MRRVVHALTAFVLAGFCGACGHLPQRSRLTAVSPLYSNLDPEWEQTDEVIADGVRIKVMNSTQDLHLLLSMDDKVLQDEFTGQYGQSIVFWFGTQPEGHGIRVDFKLKPNQTAWVNNLESMDRSVTLLGPGSEAFPRAWKDGAEGVECNVDMHSGTLIYELRVPLQAARPGGFALGAQPGDKVQVSVQASVLPELGLPGDAEEAPQAPIMDPAYAGPGHPSGLGVGGRHRRMNSEAVVLQQSGPYAYLWQVELRAPRGWNPK